MSAQSSATCTAFAQKKIIAQGSIRDVAVKLKEYLKKSPKAQYLVFDDVTSQQLELDLRGTVEAVALRFETAEELETEIKAGPGRPKLGVVSREVTLLPRHWEWLSSQPGGASTTLRKLVEAAQKKNQPRDEIRKVQESVYKFMTVMAGDLPHYEEALRAFYAKKEAAFTKLIAPWPADIRKHINKLAKVLWTN